MKTLQFQKPKQSVFGRSMYSENENELVSAQKGKCLDFSLIYKREKGK
jgi:hypothetical protein